MEENKKKQFDRIDELLNDTSAENRIKFDTPQSNEPTINLSLIHI